MAVLEAILVGLSDEQKTRLAAQSTYLIPYTLTMKERKAFLGSKEKVKVGILARLVTRSERVENWQMLFERLRFYVELKNSTVRVRSVHQNSKKRGRIWCFGPYGKLCFHKHKINPFLSIIDYINLARYQFDHLVSQIMIKDALSYIISIGSRINWTAFRTMMFQFQPQGNLAFVKVGRCHPTKKVEKENPSLVTRLVRYLTAN